MSLGCFNILSATELERYRVRLERTLPIKGKKEFAPNGSWVERKQLEAARDERHALLKEERVERVGTLSVAEWDEKMNVAVVTYSVGKHWENFGHQQEQIRCLNPEEALFLLETSNLLLLHNNVGLSVQQGYNTLLGQRTGCTLDSYRVFSHLARHGFRLKRHDGPLFILTDYERRIGLQSYLYPSRHGIVSIQEQPNDHCRNSENAGCHENTAREVNMSSEGNGDEVVTNYIKSEHVDTLSESHVKSKIKMPKASEGKLFASLGDEIISSTVKSEDNELGPVQALELCSNNTLSSSTGTSIDISNTNIKNEKHPLSSKDSCGHISNSHWRTEIQVSKTPCSSISAEDTIQSIKHEHRTDDFSSESVNTEKHSHENRMIIPEIEMKMESGLQKSIVEDGESFISKSVSAESSLKEVIKEEAVVTENACEVSMEGTDSCNITESAEEQELDTHLHNKMLRVSEVSSSELKKKENLKKSHDICLISDSSVSGYSDVMIEQEEQEQKQRYRKTHHPLLVNLVNYDKDKLCDSHRKMRPSHEPVVIEEFSGAPNLKTHLGQQAACNNSSKCEIDMIDISSTAENMASGTLNQKTVVSKESFVNKSMKCEIDIADISSTEENVDVCPDVTNNKVGDDIFCVDHKRKSKRKRRISNRKSSIKSEKSYIVDVETGAVMHSDENLVLKKVAKREGCKDISEIIVLDDIDSPCGNDGAVEMKDEELELELSRFYEEITVVDLTGEDSRTKTRSEILDMFPNFAGVKIATVRVPPSDLLPENVTPSQQEYQIDLQSLLADRPNWIVRRSQFRGRDAHQRFKHRRGYYRHQQYQELPHHHVADERNYTHPHAIPEEFSHHVRIDCAGQSVSQSYCNPFNHQTREEIPLAVIDTSGDFSTVKRFEHQRRYFSTPSNKKWYERTWVAGSQSDGFIQHSESPSASPQCYQHMAIDNRFTRHHHNDQRWNRGYNRNTTNRRNPRGRSRFRSSHHPAPHRRQTTRMDNLQEQATEYNWKDIQNVAGNAKSWFDFKKLLSNRNSEEPSVECEQETLTKVEEEGDEEEEELPVEPLDEESEEEEIEWKPLIQPSDCTDIGSILAKLNVFKEIPGHTVQIPHAETTLKINYDIYLPTTRFKKSSPCMPDYRLCIIGCEGEVPSAGEISFLLKDLQDDVPLLFAVVVPDSIAFYHFVNISLPMDDSCPV